MPTAVAADPVSVANRLRPVLLRLNRELRREIHSLGVTGGQVSLLVQIQHSPGVGVRELATHERSFGLWRSNGSPKPALAEVTQRVQLEVMPPPATPWLDIDVEEFEASRREQLVRLYHRYRAAGAAEP